MCHTASRRVAADLAQGTITDHAEALNQLAAGNVEHHHVRQPTGIIARSTEQIFHIVLIDHRNAKATAEPTCDHALSHTGVPFKGYQRWHNVLLISSIARGSSPRSTASASVAVASSRYNGSRSGALPARAWRWAETVALSPREIGPVSACGTPTCSIFATTPRKSGSSAAAAVADGAP